MNKTAAAEKFNEIYSETNRAVLIYITAKCSNPSDIADIFQDTYAEVFSAIKRHGAGYIESPLKFAIGIAKHQLHRHYSRMKRMQKVTFDEEFISESEEAAEPFDIEIDDSLVSEQLMAKVRDIIADCSVDTQKIFYLHFSLELTLRETAQQLDMSEAAVKSRLYRTLQKLKAELEEQEETL